MHKLSIISRSLSKISHKRYELYVISRIIHLLNDPNIKYNFQQYVRRPSGGIALVDLYLPQVKLGIEVDEAYHLGQVTEDQLRQKDILVVTDIKKILRIDCSKRMEVVNAHIDRIIETIKSALDVAKNENKYTPWDGLSGYEHYMAKPKFTLDDDTELASPTEICNCFGMTPFLMRGGHKWINPKDGKEYLLWWPRENYEVNGRLAGKWYNKLEETEDETIIWEACLTSEEGSTEHHRKLKKHKNIERIVFYTKRNALNERLYRFYGVFKLDWENCPVETINGKQIKKCKWVRIATEIELPTAEDYEKALDALSAKYQRNDKDLSKLILRYTDTNDNVSKCIKELQNEWEAGGQISDLTINGLKDAFECAGADTQASPSQSQPGEDGASKQPYSSLIKDVENIKKWSNSSPTKKQDEIACEDVELNDKLTLKVESLLKDWIDKRLKNELKKDKYVKNLLEKHILTLYDIKSAGAEWEENIEKYIKQYMKAEWETICDLEYKNTLYEKFKDKRNK